MESPCQVILDSTNYFQSVSYMEDLLRSKGLYRIVTGQEKKPKDEDKVAKLENRQDQARGLIGMSISPDLRFHIAELDTPHEALEQITKVFGIKNEIRAHQLENELLTLDPNNFLALKISCPNSRPLDISWKVLREQEKLLHLGLLNLGNSSKKALAAQQQPNLKNPKKSYPKKNGPKPNKGPKQTQSQNERSFQQNDKTNKNKWKTDRHCNFCNRDGHLESKCFKNMEALEAAMKKHNIHVEHSSTSTSTSSSGMALSACRCQTSQFDYALNVSSSFHSHEWLIDSGASYHMAKNKAMFSSLHDCNTKNIYVGDDRSLNVLGTGTVHLDNGQFNDVLCVPTLSSNLLSVYQITHSGEGKIVEFSPHDVVIKDLRDPKQILATGIADDSTRLYKFHNFGLSNLPSVFVAHNDEVSKLWHE
eukprot:PITA_21452